MSLSSVLGVSPGTGTGVSCIFSLSFYIFLKLISADNCTLVSALLVVGVCLALFRLFGYSNFCRRFLHCCSKVVLLCLPLLYRLVSIIRLLQKSIMIHKTSCWPAKDELRVGHLNVNSI